LKTGREDICDERRRIKRRRRGQKKESFQNFVKSSSSKKIKIRCFGFDLKVAEVTQPSLIL
jgi:hypothetical protein